MRNIKLFITLLAATCVCFCLLACEGDTGSKGLPGPDGEDGADFTYGAPSDRVFALAIFNGTQKDHNGNNTITLTFDSTATPSKNVVVGNKIDKAPLIDGIDEGSTVWGSNVSTIELTQQAFRENKINECKVRCAYTDYTIYFQLKWTEVEEEGFVVSENKTHMPWKYIDSLGSFEIQAEYEDRVALMFPPDKPKQFWGEFGCLTACHLGDGEPDYMRSTSGSNLIDVWQWGSARSQALGIGLDRCLTNIPGNGFVYDGGISPLYPNFEAVILYDADDEAYEDTIPNYMHIYQEDNPDFQPDDPLREALVMPYDEDVSWTSSSILPSWIFRAPSEGNDLIMCEGKYDNGTWTVEFSRIRRTKDVYDANF